MFNPKILFFCAVCFIPAGYGFNFLGENGYGIVISEGWTIHPFGFLGILFFCAGVGSAGLLAASLFFIVLSSFGLGTAEERPVSVDDFTIEELRQLDKEEEPHWNETHRQTASAAWDGIGHSPVYEDYRGFLRNAHTNEAIGNNHTDQRRVVNGKIVRFAGKNLRG